MPGLFPSFKAVQEDIVSDIFCVATNSVATRLNVENLVNAKKKFPHPTKCDQSEAVVEQTLNIEEFGLVCCILATSDGHSIIPLIIDRLMVIGCTF